MTDGPRGFIAHDGGICPFPEGENPSLVLLRGGQERVYRNSMADGWWVWHELGTSSHDIIGYVPAPKGHPRMTRLTSHRSAK